MESKMMSSPVRAASNDGTDVPWPPLWPGDDASGRGGIGPGGRGHTGAAERSGRGGPLGSTHARPGGAPDPEGRTAFVPRRLLTRRRPDSSVRGTRCVGACPLRSTARSSRRRAFSAAALQARRRGAVARAAALRRRSVARWLTRSRPRRRRRRSGPARRPGWRRPPPASPTPSSHRLSGGAERRGDNARRSAQRGVAGGQTSPPRLGGPEGTGRRSLRPRERPQTRAGVANRATNRLATVVSPGNRPIGASASSDRASRPSPPRCPNRTARALRATSTRARPAGRRAARSPSGSAARLRLPELLAATPTEFAARCRSTLAAACRRGLAFSARRLSTGLAD